MAGDIDNVVGGSRNRWSLLLWIGAAALLSLPAIAMQFPGSGVDWSPGDFLAMGLLLALACGGYEVATRLSGNTAYRAGAALAILTCFLTVWVNLAVGMVGDEDNLANLLFGGVILVGVVGTVLAGFKPRGVSRAMQAAAAGQAAMVVVALVMGDYVAALPIAFFTVPWLLSGHLFLKAARQQARVDGEA